MSIVTTLSLKRKVGKEKEEETERNRVQIFFLCKFIRGRQEKKGEQGGGNLLVG